MAGRPGNRKPRIDESGELRRRLAELEETLSAIRNGEVDALVISSETGDQVYTLQHAERPYRFMIEQMNEGATMLSSEGVILFCNEAFARILKSSAEELLATRMSQYVSPSSRIMFERLLKYGGRETLALLASDDTLARADVTLSIMHGDKTFSCSMIITNLADTVAVQRLAASEKFARTLLEQSADAIIICDPDGRIIQASEKAFAITESNIKGLLFDQVFAGFRCMPAGIMKTRDANWDVSFAAVRNNKIHSGIEIFEVINGEPGRYFFLTFSQITEDGSIIGYSISLTDITERKRTEQELHHHREHLEELVAARTRELRDLAHRLVDAQEKERAIIGNGLHDEIGQYLTYTALLIERAARKDDPTALADAKSTVQEAIVRIRDLSSLLSPRLLRSAGILVSLVSLTRDYSKRTGIKVNFTHDHNMDAIPDDVALAGYRIIQEALTNVARHAGATEVNVKLLHGPETLHVEIGDNGCGFDASTISRATGLTGMRERALALDGEFNIVSHFGSGTLITADLPLRRSEEHANHRTS